MTLIWIDAMRQRPAIDTARALGITEVSKTPLAWCIACPACNAERRHKRSKDRRGAVGISKSSPRGWRCWQCDATGDAIDLVAFRLGGARYRDLSDAAKRDVREWCCRWLGLDAPRSSTTSSSPAPSTPRAIPAPIIAAPAPRDEAPATYPPLPEVATLWLKYSKRVDEDAACSSYLRGRGLDPVAIADLDLARAITPRAPLPSWARLGRAPWSLSGHRCGVKLYDCKAVSRSVLARSLDPKAERKSVAPRGHTRAGLVMACGIGKRLLRYGTHPSAWPSEPSDGVPFDSPRPWWPAEQQLTVVICEGEIDFLAWATQPSDAAEHAHATLGIVQGSWSDAIAQRIPDGCRIVLAQDLDDVGNKYAKRVAATLRGRPIELQRWKPRAAA